MITQLLVTEMRQNFYFRLMFLVDFYPCSRVSRWRQAQSASYRHILTGTLACWRERKYSTLHNTLSNNLLSPSSFVIRQLLCGNKQYDQHHLYYSMAVVTVPRQNYTPALLQLFLSSPLIPFEQNSY